jgi:hypothetical protein
VDRPAYRRNPLRMIAARDTWKAAAYLVTYVPVGLGLFGIVVALMVVGWALSAIWLGLPIVVGSAVFLRGCATVERLRAWPLIGDVATNYREPGDAGVFTQIKTRWTDPSTIRNLAYFLLYPFLVWFDAAAFAIFAACLGMMTLPAWYWAIPAADGSGYGVFLGFPEPGPGGFGVWIGDLPSALGATLAFLILAVAASYLVVWAARVHLAVVRSLLGEYTDPLAEAKRVLAEPGPLSA